MLRQQLAIIPEDIQVEVEALSKLGLLQMGRMYELMYRGPRGGESDSGRKSDNFSMRAFVTSPSHFNHLQRK
jgi:hypothetical protein